MVTPTRIARSYQEGIDALEQEAWDLLVLDHDLADFSGPENEERTGFHVLDWLGAHLDRLPEEIQLITDNGSRRLPMVTSIQRLYERWREQGLG